MSLSAQCILPGHLTVLEVAHLLTTVGLTDVRAVARYRPEHWEIHFSVGLQLECVMDVFLNSWAAEDHMEAYSGPSTLLTMPASEQASGIFRELTKVRTAAMWRAHEADDWR